MVSAAQVKELREMTGAGMMDCKNALVQSNGDMEKAKKILREKGLAAAAKKAGRIASEGLVEAYIHGDGRIGVLVEVNTETDFAAKNQEFKAFVKDIALQIAASRPEYIKAEDVPESVVEQEKAILKAQAIKEGKPEKIAEKIVEGRISKFYKDICLLEQPFIKDPDKSVQDILNEKVSNIGENIQIRRFVCYERGQGLQKKEENFADEVAKQMNK